MEFQSLLTTLERDHYKKTDQREQQRNKQEKQQQQTQQRQQLTSQIDSNK
mgnify:CR=1 FL=1